MWMASLFTFTFAGRFSSFVIQILGYRYAIFHCYLLTLDLEFRTLLTASLCCQKVVSLRSLTETQTFSSGGTLS